MSAMVLKHLVVISLLEPLVWGMNGMDMSMDGPMALAGGQMLPYLHLTPGDIVWFQGWVPQSKGAMIGACIGLFLLALVDRWLSAIRGVAQAHWRNRAYIEHSNRLASVAIKNGHPSVEYSSHHLSSALRTPFSRRKFSPFNVAHDLPRGFLYAAQMALNFAFMLVVMSFQVSFILAIIIGMGVGEMLFGRYLDAVSTH